MNNEFENKTPDFDETPTEPTAAPELSEIPDLPEMPEVPNVESVSASETPAETVSEPEPEQTPVYEYTPSDSYNSSAEGSYTATEAQKANSGTPYTNPYANPYANPYSNPYAAPRAEKNSTAQPTEPQVNPYSNQNEPSAQTKPRKNRGLVVFLIVLVIVFAFTAAAFAGMYFFSDSIPGVSQNQEGGVAPNNGPDLTLQPKPDDADSNATSADGKLTVTQIATKVRPSVVGVVAYAATSFETLGQSSASYGSGVIMSKDGYIITNAHVVSGAARVAVVLDNEEEYEAKVIGSDTKTDLAVLKIDKNNLSVAEFGDSSETQVGEDVVAIGNPSGLELAGSLTRGIVSAVDRPIQSSETAYTMNCIQTDAAINPGNSGGALVNMYGQVIGINSSKIASVDYEGIGFAIASNDVKPVVDDLIKYGYVKGRAKIGITYQEISATYAAYVGVPAGLYVQAVDESVDCYKQGLRAGDIITKIDGKAIDGSTVTEYLKGKKAGDKVKLTVYRKSAMGSDTTMTLTITLAEDKGDTGAVEQSSQNPYEQYEQYGQGGGQQYGGWDSLFE